MAVRILRKFGVLFGGIAAGVLTVALNLAWAPVAASQPQPNHASRWAILGDSYLSGQGLTPPALDAFGNLVLGYEVGTNSTRNSCFRSTTSWGVAAAQHFGAQQDDVLFVACSGAVAAHVVSTGQFPLSPAGVAGASPQLDELTAFNAEKEVDIVVLSIGGNDAGFLTEISDCLFRSTCNPTENEAFKPNHETGHTPLRDRVADVVGKTREAAPQAVILVAGYPDILPLREVTCADVAWMSLDKVAALQEYSRLINHNVRSGANDSGAIFLDLSKALKGRHLCAPHNNGVNGFGARIFSTMHPTDEGHRAIARYVIPEIEKQLQNL